MTKIGDTIMMTEIEKEIVNNSGYCIYYIHDSDNYLSGYVGFTSNLSERIKIHFRDFRKNTPKTTWIKSRIENNRDLSIDVLMSNDTKEECSFWEQFYISYYKSLGFSLKNSTVGGEGGMPSQAVRNKMSLNRKGKSTELQTATRRANGLKQNGTKRTKECGEKISKKLAGVPKSKAHIQSMLETRKRLNLFVGENNPMFGKQHSAETREKIRQKKLGQILSSEMRKKLSEASTRTKAVIVYNADNSLNGYFPSLTMAAKANSVGRSNLSACLRNKQKTFQNGKTIKYADR